MGHRLILALLAGLALAGGAKAASKPAPKAAPKAGVYHSSHNYTRQPDFNGIWSLNSLTRLERPTDIPTLVLSEAEAKAHPTARAASVKARP